MDGAAGKLTLELAAVGFDVRDATNSAGPDSDLAVSKIYVREGGEAAARSISRLMGGIDVVPMTTPAWIANPDNIGDTNVLVMLGHDLAGVDLSAMDD